ncbi:hypothetical protein DYH55_09245 [Methylovirgula sp. 4M-Z18]|nr:hypothetical protein DYH55_09245 [Methylovirgula sp. 4M-Z18]
MRWVNEQPDFSFPAADGSLVDDTAHSQERGASVGTRVNRLDDIRILMYSHDTFGLGHLRRCRTIAHALVERFKGIHVLIISGSQIAGAFDFRARVDFVKVPSVIKLYNGEYASIVDHIDIQETLTLRKSMILNAAKSYRPQILIVDKEPMGVHGELEPTLSYLKQQGTTLVLGLREVMDAPHLLRQEWAKRDMLAKIDHFFDDIWIYGPENFWNPLTGLDLPASWQKRMYWTGYLRRNLPTAPRTSLGAGIPPDALLLTVGGGGDGAQMMRQVLSAYEHDRSLQQPAILALGPFMNNDEREEIKHRASALPHVYFIDFDNNFETVIEDSAAVVSMGGYNTFCEIISLDKRALLVPRVTPREEQLIRSRRAAELGLVDMIHPDDADNAGLMAAALHRLATRPLPSTCGADAMLNGLERICDWLQMRVQQF